MKALKNRSRDSASVTPTTYKTPLLEGLEEDYSSQARSGRELSLAQVDEEEFEGASGQMAAGGATSAASEQGAEPVNNTGRSIDFEQELKAVKERTEVDVPFVATRCADAMYLDQHTIVTLEYHCYQNEAVYTELGTAEAHMQESAAIPDPKGHAPTGAYGYLLDTDRYQADPNVAVNPNS